MGIVPGRQLMSEHLPLVFALIWALFLSNWITSLVGLAISGPLARITVLRTQILAPVILCLAAVGAVATRGLLGDLVVAAVFGVLGYVMRRHGWPRVPLAIGFVLGAAFETNLLLTLRLQELGRIDMLERPIVLGLALLTLGTLLLPAWRRRRGRGDAVPARPVRRSCLRRAVVWLLVETLQLGPAARFVPQVVIVADARPDRGGGVARRFTLRCAASGAARSGNCAPREMAGLRLGRSYRRADRRRGRRRGTAAHAARLPSLRSARVLAVRGHAAAAAAYLGSS